MATINRREAAALINSLTAGVVPRIGLRHIAVGRQKEVNAFLHDLETVQDGGAAFRFVCGKYGSGKSFLIQMIRNNAMERSFVVMDADLSPERRLTGTKGRESLHIELMQHLSTKTRPEGGALESILQKWIASIQLTVARENNLKATDPELIELVSEHISGVLAELSEMSYGFAFATIVNTYWRGIKCGDDQMKQSALRWLRAEYSTKTEAKKSLPVDGVYLMIKAGMTFVKLFALFVKKAGYNGLIIFLDEGVNLYKITHKQARNSNYEKLLTIFNDTMQGKAHYFGVFMSGTPQFIYDERRGLFSYEALKSRLVDNRFSSDGFIDYTGPVIKLNQLSPEEIYLLLERLCELGEQELSIFLNSVLSRLGADQLLTPREVTRDF